jgi:hypothetical protein
LLRAGHSRHRIVTDAIAGLATDTGQWPEAIHPQLRTGCMGDGQHAWAAAEWIMIIRNSFLFEEEFEDRLIVGAGLSTEWCGGEEHEGQEIRADYGPAPTRFGPVSVSLEVRGDTVELKWSGEWFGVAPEVEVRMSEDGLEIIGGEPGLRRYRKTRKSGGPETGGAP